MGTGIRRFGNGGMVTAILDTALGWATWSLPGAAQRTSLPILPNVQTPGSPTPDADDLRMNPG